MKNLFKVFVGMLVIVSVVSIASAEQIYLQGTLYDDNGVPITGNKTASLKLYNSSNIQVSPADGSSYSVPLVISEGAFSTTVDLGNLVIDKPLFAELKVDGKTHPRIPLAASYAKKAGELVAGPDNKIRATGQLAIWDPNLPFTPEHSLHIKGADASLWIQETGNTDVELALKNARSEWQVYNAGDDGSLRFHLRGQGDKFALKNGIAVLMPIQQTAPTPNNAGVGALYCDGNHFYGCVKNSSDKLEWKQLDNY